MIIGRSVISIKAQSSLMTPGLSIPAISRADTPRRPAPKGCMLVEVDDDRISTVELVDLAVVRWESAVVDLKGKRAKPNWLKLSAPHWPNL